MRHSISLCIAQQLPPHYAMRLSRRLCQRLVCYLWLIRECKGLLSHVRQPISGNYLFIGFATINSAA